MPEMSESAEKKPPPKVSFRVTIYWRRKRGEPGLTNMQSRRLNLEQALNLIVDQIPDEALAIRNEGGKTVVVINWAKVPEEIANGTT